MYFRSGLAMPSTGQTLRENGLFKRLVSAVSRILSDKLDR